MSDNVLWRKIARIIFMMQESLGVSSARALNIFYSTRVSEMLHDRRYGLYLMSDAYIFDDIMTELTQKQ